MKMKSWCAIALRSHLLRPKKNPFSGLSYSTLSLGPLNEKSFSLFPEEELFNRKIRLAVQIDLACVLDLLKPNSISLHRRIQIIFLMHQEILQGPLFLSLTDWP